MNACFKKTELMCDNDQKLLSYGAEIAMLSKHSASVNPMIVFVLTGVKILKNTSYNMYYKTSKTSK